MKSHSVENIPAVKRLSDFFIQHNIALPSTIKTDIESVLEGIERLDGEVKQKEQLLVQKEKELVRLKSITDNSSKVARDIISESKSNLDQAVSLHKSGNFSEALKYTDLALYNIGDINNFGVKTVEQANKLYLERLGQYKDSATKRDYFYNQGVINGVNAFSWVKDNPTRDFYSFFRDTLKVSDKSPENVNLIQNRLYKNLPKYLEEAHRANSFYSEYNKYYDAMTKLQQVINIYNIKAASSKGLEDYEDALKSCEIALEIDPKNLTLSNLKSAVLQEKQVVEAKKLEEEQLLVSQTQEIEKLKELLARKEVETQKQNKLLTQKELEKQELIAQKEKEKKELLTQKGNELASKEKVLIDQHTKETGALKALLAQKELEHQELLARKDKEVKELEKVKNELLKKELFDILPQVYPSAKDSGYNKPFAEWDTSWWGKKVIDAGNFEEIKRYLPELREKAARIKEENLKKQAKVLENTKKLEEENLKKEELLGNKDKLLSDKEQEIAKVKELLSIKEVETKEQNKLLTQKELEKQELIVQKEKEKKELLVLKEKQAKELENAKRLQEENIKKEQLLSNQNKLLSDKEQEIAKVKELLSIKESETEELLARKELEKQELLIQKEREKEELLAQRDKELQELEKVNNDVLIKEFIEILPQRYPDLYPKNFAEWPHDIWGKQVVDGNDIEAIKHYLPIYRKEVIENLNQLILTERAKIEELLVEKANVQQKLIDKDNLLSDQTEDIERINVLLETKGIIIQRLEQEKEILQTRHDILDMKMQLTVKEFTVREREKDKALLEKDTELKKLAESSKLLADYQEEMLKFKELCAIKDAEIREKDELLNQKELEKQELLVQKEIEKGVLVDDLQEKLHFKDSEILGLQMMVNDMNLAGEYHIVELND